MDSSKQSLIPTYLYSTSLKNRFDFKNLAANRSSSGFSSYSISKSPDVASKDFVVQAPSEPGKIKMYSPAFYAACAVSGSLSCWSTHTAVTPLDVVKCNMQVKVEEMKKKTYFKKTYSDIAGPEIAASAENTLGLISAFSWVKVEEMKKMKRR